jgi:O-antigen ligase
VAERILPLALALPLAVVIGVLVSVRSSPLNIAVTVVVLCASTLAVARLGVVNGLLHALVLSVFAESISVGSFTVGRLLTPVILLTIAGRWLLTPWKPPRTAVISWLPAVAYITWAWASGFWALHTGAWTGAMGGLVLAVAYFSAFALFIRTETQVLALMRTYAVGATAAGILALVQWQAGGRAVGLQGDPNIFALYETLAVPVATMLARRARGPAKLIWVLTIVVDFAAVVAAESRGGLVTLVVLVVFLAARADFGSGARRTQRLHTVGAVAALLAIVIASALLIGGRLSPARALEDRGSGRLDIWRVAYVAWTAHPVLGLGAGNFKPESGRLLQETPGVGLSPNNPLLITGIKVHNVYLENLVETGPLGLGAWLVLIGVPTREILRRQGWRANDSPWSPLLPMILAFAFATMFLSITNNKILWIMIGLAATLPRLEKTRLTGTRSAGAR